MKAKQLKELLEELAADVIDIKQEILATGEILMELDDCLKIYEKEQN